MKKEKKLVSIFEKKFNPQNYWWIYHHRPIWKRYCWQFRKYFSDKLYRLDNWIYKIPHEKKVLYFFRTLRYWKTNNKNIWVEIYFWLIKNKVVLQETKKGLVIYPKSKSEEAERKLKFYNQI